MSKQRDWAAQVVTKGMTPISDFNVLYGDSVTGKVSKVHFPGSFYFVTNLKLEDFDNEQFFPSKKRIIGYLSTMSYYYANRL